MEGEELFDSRPQAGAQHITLRRGRGNALRTNDLHRLAEELERLEADGAPPLVISASGRSFCTGLDLRAAIRLDREGMAVLMAAFHRALSALFFYSGGVVAAVGGHALAGGAVLALAADRRVFAAGSSRVGIHGVSMGVAYPDIAVETVRARFPRPEAEAILYRGATFAASDAVRKGWGYGPVESATVTRHSLELVRELGMGGPSFAAHKRALLAPARERLRPGREHSDEVFLDIWFLDETQAALTAAVERLDS